MHSLFMALCHTELVIYKPQGVHCKGSCPVSSAPFAACDRKLLLV